MSRREPRDLPFAPVAAILEQRNRVRHGPRGEHLDDEWVGRVLGRQTPAAARRKAMRVKQQGLTVWEADRLAIALGWMPWTIWGDDWFRARDRGEDTAAGLFRLMRWHIGGAA